MRSLGLGLAAGAALALSAGGAAAQDAALGEKVFQKCRACHQIGDNARNMVGPGRGRPAGRRLSRL
jgi:cytochrome c